MAVPKGGMPLEETQKLAGHFNQSNKNVQITISKSNTTCPQHSLPAKKPSKFNFFDNIPGLNLNKIWGYSRLSK